MQHADGEDDPYWNIVNAQVDVDVRYQIQTLGGGVVDEIGENLIPRFFTAWGWEYRHGVMPYEEYPQ